MTPRILALGAFVLAFIATGLRAQEPAVPDETPAPDEVPASDEIGKQYATRRSKAEGELDAARDELLAEFAKAIDAEQNARRKQRLEAELAAFETTDLTPALLRKGAIDDWNKARQSFLRKLSHEAKQTAAAYDKAGNSDAAEEFARLRDDFEDEVDDAAWTDVRRHRNFENSVGRAGASWDGTSVLAADGQELKLRVPSALDGAGRFPDWYQARFDIERVAGTGPLRILLPLHSSELAPRVAVLVLDGGNGTARGLETVAGRAFDSDYNPTAGQGSVLEQGRVVRIQVTCGRKLLRVETDDATIVDFDEPRTVATPRELLPRFEKSLNAIHLLAAPEARFRIASLAFRSGADKDEPQVGTRAGGRGRTSSASGDDWLAKGRTFRGRIEDGLRTTAVVVARDRARKTATIQLRGANGMRWAFHVIGTNATDSQFRIDKVRRLDTNRVKIYEEGGSGSVGSERIELRFHWHNRHGGARKYIEGSYTGKS
ncbi:MAG: hypothetical protein KDE27_20890 [Planctomycetes bacterium]|nr:hypothetical protein [Planctomycetota bacterium]